MATSQANRHRIVVGAASRPGNTSRGRLTAAIATRRGTGVKGGGHVGAGLAAPGIGTTQGGHVEAAASVAAGVAAWGATPSKGYNGPGVGLLDGMEPWHAVALVAIGIIAGLVFAPRR